MISASRLSVRLVLHETNRAWILEKFANRLAEHLGSWGFDADISDGMSPSADVHHFMMYIHGPKQRVTPSTALITHVDRPHKVVALGRLLDRVDVGICLSRMTVNQLVAFNLPGRKLCFVVPGCDPLERPRRTIIAIASRLYRDLRKREDLLVRLAKSMRLDEFQFEIMGLGWEEIAAELRMAGAVVNHYPPSSDYATDHAFILDRFRVADFYFYPGLDEGSMGLLDALALGLPTISTPQGFHLDIPGALTHPFTEFPEMLAIFEQLARERRRRIEAVNQLSWSEYARRHAQIWRTLLTGEDVDFRTVLDPIAGPADEIVPPRSPVPVGWVSMWADEGRRLGKYAWKVLRQRARQLRRTQS